MTTSSRPTALMGKCGSIAAVVARDVREGPNIVQLVHLVVVQGPKVFAARYATERARVDYPNWRLETVAVFGGTDLDFTYPIVPQVWRKTSRQNIRICLSLRHIMILICSFSLANVKSLRISLFGSFLRQIAPLLFIQRVVINAIPLFSLSHHILLCSSSVSDPELVGVEPLLQILFPVSFPSASLPTTLQSTHKNRIEAS